MSIHAVPRLPPGLAARPRLTMRLDGPAAVVVLHAPSGFGKTAALTQWATRADRSGVWFRAREGMSEPAAFVQEISAELADAGLLDEANPLRTAGESLALLGDPWSLLRRGLRRIPGDFTLVLDEAEHLDDATIAGVLRTVEEHPGLSLRVATRRHDRFSEPGLDLRLEVDRLGPADLALTETEAADILGPAASAGSLAHVLDHGASPALARIVSLAGRATHEAGEDAVEAAVTSLVRLRSPSWDARFRSFLERVSLSEAVDVELAHQLTGDPDPVTLLDRAEAEGLGYWSSPPAGERAGTLFIPSPVFRRILAASTRRRLPGRVTREMDSRIARWNLAGQRPFPALQSAVHSRDWKLVTDVVRVHWYDLFRNAEEVRELFRKVPPLTLRGQPLVCMLLAILWNARDAHRLRALEYFALAAYGARTHRTSASPADRALLATIESAAQRVSGRTEPALRAALGCYELLRDMSLEERERLGRNESTIYNQIGLSLYYGGRVEEALDCFRRSQSIGVEKRLQAGLQGMAHEAGVLAATGHLPRAAATAKAALGLAWPDGWQEGYPGSLLQAALTLLALEADDPDAAAGHLATLAPHRATIEHWALLEHLDVLIHLMHGDTRAAARQLDLLERAQQRRNAAGSASVERVRPTRILADLARGDTAAAERGVAKLPPGVGREVSRARVRLASGNADGALQALAAAPPDHADPRLGAEHLALTAGALAVGHDGAGRSAAVSAMRRLGDQLSEQRLFLPLVLVPRAALAAMRTLAAEEDLEPDFRDALAKAEARGIIGSHQRGPELTQREEVVARALASGETVAQIAADLSVSPNTIKSQLRAIYRKLGVGSREDAIRVLAFHRLEEAADAEEDAAMR